MDSDVILYAVVAIGLALWLRSILGTRGADEPSRPNPFSTPADAAPLNAAPKMLSGPTPALAGPAIPVLGPNMSIATPGAQDALSDIARADRLFDLARFMHGAQDAFIMIVEAFSRAERDTLRGLLSDDVYAAFARALDTRQQAGQAATVEIHAVRRVEAVAAKLDGKQASVTVRFVSDQTDVLRNAAGAVVQGNPERVSEIIDVWTFARDLRSKDPSWLVTGTQEESAADLNPAAPPGA